MLGVAATETVTTSTTAPSDEPSRTDVYRILGNERRRYALHYLLQQEELAASKYELSRQIAAWENGVPVEEVTANQRKRVYIALHQNHVPQMVDRGIVEYDDGDEEIFLADGVEDIDVYMDVVRGGNVPWSQFYLGLGVIGASTALLGWVGLIPFSWLPGYGWAMLVALAVTAAGAIHVRQDRKYRLGRDGPPPEWEDRMASG